MLLATVSCGRPAQIASFTASPLSLTAGNSAQLCYELINAVSARVDPDVGELSDKTKSCLKVEPRQTTRYTLVAKGDDDKPISTEITVNVTPPPLANIVKFEAKQDATTRDPGSPAELCYEVTGASSLSIKPDIGNVEPVDKGCRTVKPNKTTTYELAATGTDNQTVSGEAVVSVVQPPARIVRFDVSRTNIKAGEKVRMCYQVRDATSAHVTNLNYSVKLGPSECIDFAPPRSTTFTLEARNADGQSVRSEARVMVEHLPVAIASFTAQPSEVEEGNETVFYYKIVNAKSAQITHPGGVIPLKSPEGSLPFKPLNTAEFVLTAKDPDGKPTSETIKVKVVPPAQVRFLIKPGDLSINRGAEAKLCYGVTGGSTVNIHTTLFPARKNLTPSENRCITFRPNVTDTYTLTATGPNGVPAQVSAKVTVKIPPPDVRFFAQSATQRGTDIRILRGHQTQLCYVLANVESFTITPRVGDLQLTTGKCVNLGELEKDALYTLRVVGSDGTTLPYHVTIRVYPPPEILSFQGRTSGGRDYLCFQYRYFSRAEISPAIADLSRFPNGSGCVPVPSPPSPHYTLTVYGRGTVAPVSRILRR